MSDNTAVKFLATDLLKKKKKGGGLDGMGVRWGMDVGRETGCLYGGRC